MELGEILLARSEKRLETVSRNVSNVSTPGFKREIPFADIIAGASGGERAGGPAEGYTDFAQGALQLTGAPLDLAISGKGFFRVTAGDQVLYVRGGQFSRREDGRVATSQGLMLQTASGEDLVLDAANFEILGDGVVLQGGAPVARIGVFGPPDGQNLVSIGGGAFSDPSGVAGEVGAPVVRQGMLEASNVEMAKEMVTMMEALRQGESGARLIQLYDSLIGQSVSTFGQMTK
ncbi:MAG TPA: flagellar hook basal-body protein [Hyphomonadaceae bacterium]|jgi:flagellar basal body rod protein FlgG|nr:flagellar hook basal-body protein [Hyphomonadaceae bacterium]